MSVTKLFAQTATKLLQLQSCKATIVRALKEHVLAARIHFCNQFLQSVHDEANPQIEFFSHKAWFSLCGEVKSQKSRYWSAEYPGLIHEHFFMMKKLVFGGQRVHAMRSQYPCMNLESE
jgi:hypothetical protein